MIHAMLQNFKFALQVMRESAFHASYILNVVSGKANEGMTPNDFLIKNKPNIRKVCVFSCTACTNELKEKRYDTFAQSVRAGILLGHHEGMNLIWDIKRNVISGTNRKILDETAFTERAINTPGLEHM